MKKAIAIGNDSAFPRHELEQTPAKIPETKTETHFRNSKSGTEVTGKEETSNARIILLSVGICIGLYGIVGNMTFVSHAIFLCIGAVCVLLGLVLNPITQNQLQEQERQVRERQKVKAFQDAQIVCPHCQIKGMVRTQEIIEKLEIREGFPFSATVASHEKKMTEAKCSHCGQVWRY